MMQNDDYDLIVKLATSSASLDRSPKKNWVENAGQLPPYVRKIARAIERSGKPLSTAIAIAISRIKRWAAGGGDVDADTRAKAAKALAAWEALKAKNKAKKVVKASNEYGDYLMLSHIPSFKTDIVRSAWEAQERLRRNQWEKDNPRNYQGDMTEIKESYYPYRWIKELWTDFILVETESGGQPELVKVKYTVNPISQDVTFSEEVEVRQVFIEMDDDLSDAEKELLEDLLDS